jgi:hypothetical protein
MQFWSILDALHTDWTDYHFACAAETANRIMRYLQRDTRIRFVLGVDCTDIQNRTEMG